MCDSQASIRVSYAGQHANSLAAVWATTPNLISCTWIPAAYAGGNRESALPVTRSILELSSCSPAKGPLYQQALADLIGLDVCLYVMDVLRTEFADSKYRACPLLRKMVAAGYLGRKSGRGFFEYGD